NLQTGFLFNHIYEGSQGALGSIDHVSGEDKFSAAARNYDFNRPQHTNQDDSTIWYQGSFFGQSSFDRRYRFQFDPSISVRGRGAGTHDAKIGIQLKSIASTYDAQFGGHGVGYVDSGGGPGEAGLCDETAGTGGCFLKIVNHDYSQSYKGFSGGVYLQ